MNYKFGEDETLAVMINYIKNISNQILKITKTMF